MAPQRKTQSQFTDGPTLYNKNLASLTLGFVNKSAFMKISPVFEDMKGKRPRAGTTMYDRDKGILISLSLSEIIWLKHNFDELLLGNIPAKQWSHSYSEDIKVITIGKNVLARDAGEETFDEFGVLIEIFDRQDGVNSDPVTYQYFTFVLEESFSMGFMDESGNDLGILASHYVLKEWLDSAIRISNCEALHNSLVVRSWDRDRDDYRPRNRDERGGGSPRRRDPDGDEESTDERGDDRGGRSRDRAAPRNRGRGERGSVRGSEQGDDIPF